MIDVTSEQMSVIVEIFTRYLPKIEVRAFGSRVRGDHKEYSDLDVALISSERLELSVIEMLKEAFEESDLSFRVDIVDYNAVSLEFRKIIDSRYEIIPLGDKR